MLYRFIYLIIISLVISSCSSKPDIVIADFEGSTYGAWMLEGTAFGKGPARKNHLGQLPIGGYKGYGFINSYNKEGGDARGVLTSPKFKIERDYINFLIGGGNNKDAYIELVVDGKTMIRSISVYETNQLYPMSWNVEKYKGKDAQIRIVDYQRGLNGYILIDHIIQSNTPSTNVLYNYSLNFIIDKKYLLIPIEEDAPEVKVTVNVDGKIKSSTSSYIRLANSMIDYYIALDLSSVQGENLTLTFDQINRDYVALKDIHQSNTYDFKFNENFRPLYHFSSLYGWLGNPNGLLYDNGIYHLFYQHNAYGSMWGNLSWGHATSTDLLHWKHEPTAIKPDSLGEIFSGTAIIDKHNTSGFGTDAIVAVYTSDGVSQTQSISYSINNGKSFTKYAYNPVLTDPHYDDFRDPCVFWYEPSKSWIMAVATSNTITFYESPNLKEWNKKGKFRSETSDNNNLWEAPCLFQLSYNGQTKWVLLVSTNPGAPNGGSGTQYFIGNFDGEKFIADDLPYPLWLDYGKDNYAGTIWNNAPFDRKIFIGWMSNWDYSNYVPTLNFKNALTIPRELSLSNNGKHLILKNYPIKEVDNLRDSLVSFQNRTVQLIDSIPQILDKNNGAYELLFTIEPTNSKLFSFILGNSAGEFVKVNFDLINQRLFVDRSESGIIDFVSNFSSIPITAPLLPHSAYQVRLLVDKASIELFINEGEVVQTNTIFPSVPYNKLYFKTDSSIKLKDIKAYSLKNVSKID